jgi:glycosyltransferase involved in cell wall biosynthesis
MTVAHKFPMPTVSFRSTTSALLVPPDGDTVMTTAVRRLLTEPGLAKRISSNGRHKAEQFDWSKRLPQ